MNEAILNILSGLPSTAVVMYIWIHTNTAHIKEREAWRSEIKDLSAAFNQINTNITKLNYIIENYVIIKQGEGTSRG
ncbi:MAG: hypothetical protein RR277_00390 [Rikenellaceae bacterium]